MRLLPNSPRAPLQGGTWANAGTCERCSSSLNRALWYTTSYGCPEPPSSKRRTCGSGPDYYCKNWGCETLVERTEWTPGGGQDRHIQLRREKTKTPGDGWDKDCPADNCNPTVITVLNPSDLEWKKGRTWGLRLYVRGTDPGTFFTVKQLPIQGRPLLRGKGRLPPRPQPPLTRTTNGPDYNITSSPENLNDSVTEGSIHKEEVTRVPTKAELGYEIYPRQGANALGIVEKVFPLFSETQPEITESCWLCLSPRPPFYVGLGMNSTGTGGFVKINLTDTDSHREQSQIEECFTEGSLTLAEFHGKGTCYFTGNLTSPGSNYTDYCLNQEFMPASDKTSLLKAPEGIWFICTQGIYKCLMLTNPEFCVSAYIIPQVYLYGGNPEFLTDSSERVKRTPLLIPILATLGIAGSAVVGTTALVKGETSLRQLSQTFSKDITLLQDQIIYLERQVDSLAAVALQNRRGLDLLFLQQGGLCAALGEECCFYANHSGVIKENIKTLTKRLKDR
ncbi:endogenous retrovirus group S71 member 1 Env polyprotein-like [Phyllostomus hastatus]|uniref:endogenous retrovirus group S71 member 1 Env polyprotein-like n=1 Tax=Phyllostomus hastatus TaxID=9423 RepID=UPI001E67EA4B|nr:endogenous retrovirus group S71 member 1 Env polyprotein-like [Phyllostomus hastatus]